jgi:hypothetical protein
MSLKSGNSGLKYPQFWIQIDENTIQSIFPTVKARTVKTGDFVFENGYYLTESETGGIKLCRPDGTTVIEWR